jgi:hypothetical protein
MTDDTGRQSEEFAVVLPPNARLSGMQLDAVPGVMRVSFTDGGPDRDVPLGQVIALHGARIRNEKLMRTPKKFGTPMVTQQLSTGDRPTVTRVTGDIVSTGEDLYFALALRVTDVPQLWYLIADSFNFRKALGAEAGYSTEINFRLLVRRLVAAAPQATQDGFFAAVLGNHPLPPPIGSLLEFFKTAGKDLQ